jgi:hypothetical protein
MDKHYPPGRLRNLSAETVFVAGRPPGPVLGGSGVVGGGPQAGSSARIARSMPTTATRTAVVSSAGSG